MAVSQEILEIHNHLPDKTTCCHSFMSSSFIRRMRVFLIYWWPKYSMVGKIVHYRQKIWNIFYFSDFFCIPWGVQGISLFYLHSYKQILFSGVKPLSKAKQRFKNNYFGPFSLSDDGWNSCCLIVRLLPYLFVCLLEILCTILFYIYHLV